MRLSFPNICGQMFPPHKANTVPFHSFPTLRLRMKNIKRKAFRGTVYSTLFSKAFIERKLHVLIRCVCTTHNVHVLKWLAFFVQGSFLLQIFFQNKRSNLLYIQSNLNCSQRKLLLRVTIQWSLLIWVNFICSRRKLYELFFAFTRNMNWLGYKVKKNSKNSSNVENV